MAVSGLTSLVPRQLSRTISSALMLRARSRLRMQTLEFGSTQFLAARSEGRQTERATLFPETLATGFKLQTLQPETSSRATLLASVQPARARWAIRGIVLEACLFRVLTTTPSGEQQQVPATCYPETPEATPTASKSAPLRARWCWEI